MALCKLIELFQRLIIDVERRPLDDLVPVKVVPELHSLLSISETFNSVNGHSESLVHGGKRRRLKYLTGVASACYDITKEVVAMKVDRIVTC